MRNVGWTVWKSVAALGLATMVTGCAGLLTPNSADISAETRGEKTARIVVDSLNAAKPVAEVLAPATYGLSTAGWLGITTLASSIYGCIQAIAKRNRDYALKQLHKESNTGAPSLVQDTKARKIIEETTGP